MVLNIPSDAFSHGQIKSKLWLAKELSCWSEKHMDKGIRYELNWYGSWVGMGPFLLFCQANLRFSKVNLFDLDQEALAVSKALLNFWHCEGVEINLINQDMGKATESGAASRLFINTACEHVSDEQWLKNISAGSFVLLQSTDMKHVEHINSPKNFEDFLLKYSPHIHTLESDAIHFTYPDKEFFRFMLFGRKL